MSKSKQKNNRYNHYAVSSTARFFGYSDRYVRACLKGDRVGMMPDEIIKKYKEIKNKMESITN